MESKEETGNRKMTNKPLTIEKKKLKKEIKAQIELAFMENNVKAKPNLVENLVEIVYWAIREWKNFWKEEKGMSKKPEIKFKGKRIEIDLKKGIGGLLARFSLYMAKTEGRVPRLTDILKFLKFVENQQELESYSAGNELETPDGTSPMEEEK